jgi:DNA polymerase III delta subunit
VGSDQWQLASELEKLLALDPHITTKTMQQVVIPTLQTSAFALLDAALAGRSAHARQLLQELRTQSDAYEFFGLLVWQATTLALVAAAPRMNSAELASQTGLKPFVLQKSQQLAGRLGKAKVQQIIETLANVDVQLKSSGVEPWVLLEQAVGKIA